MELKEIKIEDLKDGNEVLIIKDGNYFVSYFSPYNKFFVCQSATFIERDIYYNELDKIYLLKNN